MPMAPKTDAEKAAKLREMAKDKSLPQPVRNQYLDDANKLEEKAAMKAGVRMAKGGAVKTKKMAVGGSVEQLQQAMRAMKQPQAQQAQQATGMNPGARMVKASPVPVAAKPSAKQQAVAASNMRMAQQQQVAPRPRVVPIETPKLDLTSGGRINPVIGTPSLSRAKVAPQKNAMAQQQATAQKQAMQQQPKKPMMAKGGAVAKELPKRGSRTATNMAKGGSAMKKAKGK